MTVPVPPAVTVVPPSTAKLCAAPGDCANAGEAPQSSMANAALAPRYQRVRLIDQSPFTLRPRLTETLPEGRKPQLFTLEQPPVRACDTFRRGMILHEQPVLYSVDLSGCQRDVRSGPGDGHGGLRRGVAERRRDGRGDAVAQLSRRRPDLRPDPGESHAVLHTWPETGTVNIDIFSCSTRLKSLTAIEELGRSFGAADVSVQEIPRADGHGPPSDRRG